MQLVEVVQCHSDGTMWCMMMNMVVNNKYMMNVEQRMNGSKDRFANTDAVTDWYLENILERESG